MVEDVIERDFSARLIATFAGFDQLIGLAQSCGIDEDNVVPVTIKEVVGQLCAFLDCRQNKSSAFARMALASSFCKNSPDKMTGSLQVSCSIPRESTLMN